MLLLDSLFAGPVGPILIFFLRICDVSLSTVRILLSVRNRRLLVPIIGFFEVSIWIFAAGNAIRHLDSIWHILGYTAGFASGTAVGLWIEDKLAIGLATIRIITRHATVDLADALRQHGWGVTEFTGQGREGPVQVVFTAVRRCDIPRVIAEVERQEPNAFLTVEEPREIRRGWMHNTPRLRSPASITGTTAKPPPSL